MCLMLINAVAYLFYKKILNIISQNNIVKYYCNLNFFKLFKIVKMFSILIYFKISFIPVD